MTRASTPRVAIATALAVVVAGAIVVALERREAPAPDTAPAAAAAPASALAQPVRLPAAAQPAFTPARPTLLRKSRASVRWAPVLVDVAVRRGPRPDAATITELAPLTPEGTTNIVVVIDDAVRRGAVWDHIRLPMLPNGTTGWVPRSALGGFTFVDTHLVVDRQRLVATLLRDGRAIFRAPVGIGMPQSPTPPGSFYVREKLTDVRDPFYGPVAFGTSARSATLTDWPDGGFIGIHGTNEPELIPGRVSHGCIRLRNRDVVRLSRLMPIGTSVTVT